MENSLLSLGLSRLPDILVIFFLFFGFYQIESNLVTWQRPFRLDDPDISYDHVPYSIVPSSSVIWIAAVFPIILVTMWCIIWYFLVSRTNRSWLNNIIKRPASKGPMWHLTTYIVAHSLTLLFTIVLTDVTKKMVGRLRPDFLQRCDPVLPSSDFIPDRNPLIPVIYYNQTICLGIPHLIEEGRRSFPSGHSSASFAGLGFLALWIFSVLRPLPILVLESSQLPLSSGHGIRTALAVTPIMVAAYIAISRLQQNVHNPTDVIAGSFIGFFIAFSFWNLYIESELHFANKEERKRLKFKKLDIKSSQSSASDYSEAEGRRFFFKTSPLYRGDIENVGAGSSSNARSTIID